MKLALAIVIVVAVALVVAVRIPRSAAVLEDIPGLGWLVELIGANHEDLGPEELRFRADHPEQLARVRVADSEVVGDTLVVHAHDAFEAEDVRQAIARGTPTMRAYLVVYQSDELTALGRALDDQATKLGISLELDRIGYHLEIADDGMYVNPDWAAQHNCDTRHRIVGTGVYCWISPDERLHAYVHGDPGLFIDPHSLALPPNRTFIPAETSKDDRFYEVELPAIPLAPTTLTRRDQGVDIPIVLPARATASDAELVVQISGTLYPATPRGDVLHVETGAPLAIELEAEYARVAAGLHEIVR